MNKILIAALIAFHLNVMAQNNGLVEPDPRLFQVMDREYVLRLQSESPEILTYYNFFLDHSYYIDPLPAGKEPFWETIPFFDPATDNILSLKLKRDRMHRKYYRIGNSDKLLVMYSDQEFMSRLEQHKRNKKTAAE